MVEDAAECLRQLVAAGEEIPYEVHESGDGSPLCRYEPLTERFVHDHAAKLRGLDSFGAASAAIEAAGLAGNYLEAMGVAVPSDPRRRAELAGVAFLCRLWMDSSDFSLERGRLDEAISELEAGGDVAAGEIEVIVPIRGLQLPLTRLELEDVTLVRADTVDVPSEAQAGDLNGPSPWEPAFLAVTRVPDPVHAEHDVDPGALAVESFRRVVTTLRLYKAGGLGLGPHAWTRISGDRWRRIATGAGRPRPGGYRLAESELAGLVGLAHALAGPSTPFGRGAAERPGFAASLTRAISRFEAGLERNVVIEALNDHLLSLRFVLEGGGPADLGLAMRVAALCAEPARRAEVKAVVDRAIGLERELWSGEPAPSAGSMSSAETAAALEDLARAILRDAACGHLGSNLRVTADEILLADGLAAGEGASDQRGETEEWSVRGEVGDLDEASEPVPVAVDAGEPELIEELERLDVAMQGSPLDQRISPESPIPGGPVDDHDQIRLAEESMRTELAALETEVLPLHEAPSPPAEDQRAFGLGIAAGDPAPAEEPAREPRPGARSGRPQANPVLRLIEQTRAEREARNDRVAELFPRPETTEWNVREIAYDRRRRAAVHSGAEAS